MEEGIEKSVAGKNKQNLCLHSRHLLLQNRHNQAGFKMMIRFSEKKKPTSL